MRDEGHPLRSKTFRALAVTGLTCGLATAAILAADRSARVAARPSAPVAVVELFTSEACPQCPAAESFLKELIDQAGKTGRRVYPLAFHVDYWSPPDRRDPFSSVQFEQRQQAYIEAMRLENAYTPQMIVNGTKEFLGSQKEKGESILQAALARPARIDVKMSVQPAQPGPRPPYRIDCSTLGAPGDAVLNLALIEKSIRTRPASGSKSRTYANVVRLFRTAPVANSGRNTFRLSLPTSATAANCAVIAYVQSARDGTVLGASSADLQSPPAVQARMQPRD